MRDFPVLKVVSKEGSPIGDDIEVWLDNVKLENVTRITIQIASEHLNRAYLTMEVALDIQVETQIKDLSL